MNPLVILLVYDLISFIVNTNGKYPSKFSLNRISPPTFNGDK